VSDPLENDPIAASIALMHAQIDKLQAAIETLESVRSLVQPGSSPLSRNGAETTFGHDAFFGMTAADAARKYLAAIKKTASPKAIADALQAGEWKTASKNVPENIRTILNRNTSFVVINGEFGLAGWYPGRKSGTKSKRSSSAEADTMDESESSSEESASEDTSSE